MKTKIRDNDAFSVLNDILVVKSENQFRNKLSEEQQESLNKRKQKLDSWEKNVKSKEKRRIRKAKPSKRKLRANSKYSTYIKSELWEKRKNQYWKKHTRICTACGSYKMINLHHGYYGDFGEELDENLFALCEICHKLFHTEFGKTKKDMIDATIKFIGKIRKIKLLSY